MRNILNVLLPIFKISGLRKILRQYMMIASVIAFVPIIRYEEDLCGKRR